MTSTGSSRTDRWWRTRNRETQRTRVQTQFPDITVKVEASK